MTTDFENLEEEYTRFIFETAIMKSFTNGLKLALKMKPEQIKAMIKINSVTIEQREEVLRNNNNEV